MAFRKAAAPIEKEKPNKLSFAAAKERREFLKEEVQKAQGKKPMKTQKNPNSGTLFAKRNKRLAIREAALQRVYVDIKYKKLTTGETRIYRVAPYKFGYRMLRSGPKMMFWAYDIHDHHIKSFVGVNIQNVAITEVKYIPMWRVEIR